MIVKNNDAAYILLKKCFALFFHDKAQSFFNHGAF